MSQLLFTSGLAAALSGCLTWYFTSRFYQRRYTETGRTAGIRA